jgi:hypothetical protein
MQDAQRMALDDRLLVAWQGGMPDKRLVVLPSPSPRSAPIQPILRAITRNKWGNIVSAFPG